MPLTQAMATSFKQELLVGTHNFTAGTGDTFNLALFKANADIPSNFGAATTNYSQMGSEESDGTNYTTGGSALTQTTPTTSGTTAFLDFTDLVFSNVTLTSRGALIYNTSQGNRAVAVLDFGADRSASNGDFTIQFPTAAAGTAIIRLE